MPSPNLKKTAFRAPALLCGFRRRFAIRWLRIGAAFFFFGLPVAALLLFVWAASQDFLDPWFPVAHALGFLVLTGWFLFAMAQYQKHVSESPIFVSPLHMTAKDLSPRSHRFLKSLRRLVDWCRGKRRVGAVHRFLWIHAPLRYVGLPLLLVAGGLVWATAGEGWIQKINPLFGQEWRKASPVTVWITPPSYTGLPPLLIASPGQSRIGGSFLEVLAGSVVSVYMPGTGSPPVFQVNGEFYPLVRDAHGDYSLTQKIEKGVSMALSRGWNSLGFWHLAVKADKPPRIAFVSVPSVSEQKNLRLAYRAEDDQALKKVEVLVEPTVSMPAFQTAVRVVPLPDPSGKIAEETVFADLTSHFLAGMPVVLQLRAEDGAGQIGLSEKIPMTLPQRNFSNPLAQALVEERRQLLLNDTLRQREETASVLAGIARQRSFFRADPVVFLSLRTGAMRLVLSPSPETLQAVASVIWDAAIRIEEGSLGPRREVLRQALRSLSQGVDVGKESAFLDMKINEVGSALNLYLKEMAAQLNERMPDAAAGATLQLAYRDQALTPADLVRSLQILHIEVEQGDRAALKQKIDQIQQIVENLKPRLLKLTPEQQKVLAQFRELKKLITVQQTLVEETTHSATLGPNADAGRRLAQRQHRLIARLRQVIQNLARAPAFLQTSLSAMQEAAEILEKQGAAAALPRQGKALEALRQALISLLNGLPSGTETLSSATLGRN